MYNPVIRENIVPLVVEMEQANPGRFLSRAHVVNHAAKKLGASGQGVRRQLTAMCTREQLVEIHPDRDWRVKLPGADHLQPLYARRNGDTYELTPQRPVSRGVSQLTFIATPTGLTRHRISLRKKYPASNSKPVTVSSFVDAVQLLTHNAGVNGDTAVSLISWLPDLVRHQQAEQMRHQVEDEIERLLIYKPEADQILRHVEDVDPFIWDGMRFRRKADNEPVPSALVTLWEQAHA